MIWRSVKEAAPLLCLSEEMVYRLCSRGRLAHRRIGLTKGRGKILISDEAIDRFLESCEVGTDDGPKATRGARPRKAPTCSGRPDGKPLRPDWD